MKDTRKPLCEAPLRSCSTGPADEVQQGDPDPLRGFNPRGLGATGSSEWVYDEVNVTGLQ